MCLKGHSSLSRVHLSSICYYLANLDVQIVIQVETTWLECYEVFFFFVFKSYDDIDF